MRMLPRSRARMRRGTREIATGAASSGDGRPRQCGLASDGWRNGHTRPAIGPKHRSPCHAIGLSSVPQPDRSCSPTCSSRGSARPRRSIPRASASTGQHLADALAKPFDDVRRGVEVALQLGRSQDRPSAINDRNAAPSIGAEHVQCSAHGPRPDDVAIGKRRGDLARVRRRLADADGELGRRGDLRLHAAQPVDEFGDPEPMGSRSWRRIRHASACGQVSEGTFIGGSIASAQHVRQSISDSVDVPGVSSAASWHSAHFGSCGELRLQRPRGRVVRWVARRSPCSSPSACSRRRASPPPPRSRSRTRGCRAIGPVTSSTTGRTRASPASGRFRACPPRGLASRPCGSGSTARRTTS